MLDAIDRFIEWAANDSGSALATIFPYLLVGLLGLYLLWLVIGYLRVSQVGLADDAAHGVVAASAPRLLPASDGPIEAPRGVPFCPVDGITYPRGTVYCARDESSLVVNCANCGTRISAADDVCFHCGTNHPQADVSN
jgi:hypothetical protein